MTEELVLLSTAVSLGVLHTAVGVDHTVPFVVLGKAHAWSLKKTLGVSFLCGLGHVFSSIVVGSAGYALGITTSRLEAFEALRGNWAAWLLIAFGIVYAPVSIWRLLTGRRHEHVHVHPDGTMHRHHHGHGHGDGRVVHGHRHAATSPALGRRLVPALAVIFLLGPCEALIPLMFAPAASGHVYMPWLLAMSFSLSTLLTMLVLVAGGYSALHRWQRLSGHLARFEPHFNWAAGVAIAASGVAIEVLGV
jgi:ABC-type nickel/cobalt efflux system permease component RcnA